MKWLHLKVPHLHLFAMPFFFVKVNIVFDNYWTPAAKENVCFSKK